MSSRKKTKSKRYPPVYLPDGSKCWSGPDCQLHAAHSSTLEGALFDPKAGSGHEQQAMGALRNHVEELLDEFTTRDKTFICKQQTELDEVDEEAAETLIRTLRAARWCKEHDMYHVYANKWYYIEVTKPNNKVLDAKVNQVIIQYGVDKTEFENLKLYSRAYLEMLMQESASKDKAWLNSLAPGVAEEVAMQRQAASDRDRGKTSFKRRANPYRSIPWPDVSKLKDEDLLQFWQCGRKRQFKSEQSAWKTQNLHGLVSQSPYLCGRCNHYHLGHGDGSTPLEVQLQNARNHYKEVTEGTRDLEDYLNRSRKTYRWLVNAGFLEPVEGLE